MFNKYRYLGPLALCVNIPILARRSRPWDLAREVHESTAVRRVGIGRPGCLRVMVELLSKGAMGEKMTDKTLDAARTSLKRIQEFDSQSLPRVERLGEDFNFTSAVPPAEKLIGLFKQFPEQFLDDLPNDQLNVLRSNADSTFSMFDQILKFDAKAADAYGSRQSLISSVENHYVTVFNAISPLIAYAGTRSRDFSTIEAQGRAAIQAAKDQADQSLSDLKIQHEEGKRMLDDIRRIAAEQGVSQQSSYFKAESETHDVAANKWQWLTIYLAIGLTVYVALSIFLHKWSVLSPANTYEAIQLTASKLLIFAVIAFLLVLSARNFIASKHNAIVNRHRYNALLTFKALVDAATTPENRDIVLNHAAACIYSPQETGYSKSANERTELIPNIIQTLPKVGSGSA